MIWFLKIYLSFNTVVERGFKRANIFLKFLVNCFPHFCKNIHLIVTTQQVSGKRYEGKEADSLEGGEYEAAVNQEKEDDRKSHRELVGGALPQQMGGDQEEVSVAALNVSKSQTFTSTGWVWRCKPHPNTPNIPDGTSFCVVRWIIVEDWSWRRWTTSSTFYSWGRGGGKRSHPSTRRKPNLKFWFDQNLNFCKSFYICPSWNGVKVSWL